MNFDILDDEILNSFKDKYRDVDPLVFRRSVERAKNFNDLFEILEDVPDYPFCWDEENKKWFLEKDFIMSKKINDIL